MAPVRTRRGGGEEGESERAGGRAVGPPRRARGLPPRKAAAAPLLRSFAPVRPSFVPVRLFKCCACSSFDLLREASRCPADLLREASRCPGAQRRIA